MRIVSLLPSATEIVCLLGRRDELVGVTHECDFPASVLELPKVTRTTIPQGATSAQIDELVRNRVGGNLALYQLDEPTVTALHPDLIITQTLCDVCAVDESAVRKAACAMSWAPQVVTLNPGSLEDVFDSIQQIAAAVGGIENAQAATATLKRRVAAVCERLADVKNRPTVVFLEWIDPLFCGGHWNPQLVELAGGEELLGILGKPSFTIEWEKLRRADPDVIFIACCGFSAERARADLPILRAKAGWSDLKAVKSRRVFIADGSAYFNRPGPRLVDSLEILAKALHPEIFNSSNQSPLNAPAARLA
jgi:iron complex transport system substrate-binding protein